MRLAMVGMVVGMMLVGGAATVMLLLYLLGFIGH
jgi:hypothetical protein